MDFVSRLRARCRKKKLWRAWVALDCLTAGGGNMLAAELKRHEAQVAAGDAPPPQLPPRNLGPTLGTVKASAVSQSLPSTSHLQKMGAYPPKPRVRPSAPSFSVLPILELPEPSPLSNSLLDPACVWFWMDVWVVLCCVVDVV